MAKLVGPLYTILGGGMVWLAYLSATERLKRNGLVGMRTRATMATDAAWFAAHRASAWSIAVTALLFLGVGLWLLLTRPGDVEARNAILGSTPVVLVVVVIGGVQANRVAKSVLG